MILALDGASTDVSVALARPDGETVGEAAWTTVHRQSAELLPRALDLLAEHGVGVRELTAVAVGIGPGSFTGLRVAMALGKGLAAGLGVPIVGVRSLEAWLDAVPEAASAVARAGAREAFLLVRGEDEPRVVGADELPDGARTGLVVAPDELSEPFGLRRTRPPAGAAASIAARAARRLEATPGGDDLPTLEPAYLRVPRGASQAVEEALVRWL